MTDFNLASEMTPGATAVTITGTAMVTVGATAATSVAAVNARRVMNGL